ncbi:AsmA-like C-terminal region-containing protein [Robiginitalea sp. SC105]|uniref:AsmA-like C-terminal region-containing protein n=1 Tax=Robiginitalea sp. SC105 TaxID=2762332 RepID=UPI0016395576|nr:AsmA-like C-terminal region-containing protein [Robiginitalea sp. SC105]MBC2838889.1 AsmA-like C-terminal region-containing protein [Robiginitalea sp. SC105]
MKRKKLLKIFGGILLFLLLLVIGIPLFLEAKIGPILRSNVNKAITGEFDFEDASLSLIRNFPNARVSLTGMRITTAAPFEGDTLLTAREAYLVMGIGELFKGAGEPIGIRELYISGADLRLKIDSLEQPNYMIAVEDTDPGSSADTAEGFTFDLQDYQLRDSRISYSDRSSGIDFVLEEIQHEGTGDLSLAESRLQTRTQALISLAMDSVQYLRRNSLQLDALIGIDLGTDTYTFLENSGTINQMPLVFEGSVQLVEDGQEIDLAFRTPSSDFKNFLALIPEAYSKDLANVSTSGNFSLEGTVKGRSDDTRIPGFDIRMEATDASFRYPDLPRGIDDINFSARLHNTTGDMDDTFLEIPKAGFRIDQDAFAMNARIQSLTTNPKVDAAVKGTVNLANLNQAYPVDMAPGLSGLLRADIQTAFDMASVENKRYQDTRTSGTLQVSNLNLQTDNFREPVKISEASLRFDPALARVEKLSGTLGQSDFSLNGSIPGYLGYMFNNGLLRGDFNLSANQLVVADFMSPEPPTGAEADPAADSAFRIPENLDLTIRGQAATVNYDGLPLRNVSGGLLVRDQQLQIQDVRSDALDGKLSLNGMLSTREGAPRFDMNLGIDGFRIRETLEAIELFKTLAPIAAIVEGKLNSRVSLSGLLNEDFTPDLMSLAGNVVAEVLATDVTGNKARVLEALDTRLDFFKMEDLDLKGLKTVLNFENGLVTVRPFSFSYRDIEVTVAGSHSFDQQLNYTATLQVPAKYLGSEVNRLVTELQEPGLQEATIPVVATIGGRYSEPTVQTDLNQAVTGLTSRLVEAQKQKLLATGKDKANELIGNLLKGSPDTTATANRKDSVRTGLGNVLKDVVQGKQADTAAANTGTQTTGGQVESAARNVLGGLLKKKKDTARTTARDSVQ